MDDRLYCYENSSVLKNKYDIKDSELLEELETESVGSRMLSIMSDPSKIKSRSIKQMLCEVHFYLFNHLYNWAGEFRKIDFYKSERVLSGGSVGYAKSNEINRKLTDLDKVISKIDWNGLTSEKVCDILSATWEIHPFREGNTRSCLLTVWLLLLQKKIDLNFDLIQKNPFYVRDSLVMYSYGEKEYLLRIINDALNDRTFSFDDYVQGNSEKYKISKEEYQAFKTKYHIQKNTEKSE